MRQCLSRESGLRSAWYAGCEMNFGFDLTGRILRLFKQLVGVLPMRNGLCKGAIGSEVLC